MAGSHWLGPTSAVAGGTLVGAVGYVALFDDAHAMPWFLAGLALGAVSLAARALPAPWNVVGWGAVGIGAGLVVGFGTSRDEVAAWSALFAFLGALLLAAAIPISRKEARGEPPLAR